MTQKRRASDLHFSATAFVSNVKKKVCCLFFTVYRCFRLGHSRWLTSGQSYYAAGLIGRITSLTGPRPFVCLSVPYGFITRKWKGAEKLGLVGL